MMKKPIFVIIFFFCCYVSASEISSGKVLKIYPTTTDPNGYINFQLKNDTCLSSSELYYFSMGGKTEIKKAWLSLLLASAAAGHTVQVVVPDCNAGHKEISQLEAHY